MENWKQITFAPKYEVSNYGNIRNAKTKKLLTPRAPRPTNKQLSVFLYRECSYYRFRDQRNISQIVYNHWCLKDGETPTYYDVNGFKVKNNRIGHKDGDIYNNRADNLYRY